jgi:hypothetical protein
MAARPVVNEAAWTLSSPWRIWAAATAGPSEDGSPAGAALAAAVVLVFGFGSTRTGPDDGAVEARCSAWGARRPKQDDDGGCCGRWVGVGSGGGGGWRVVHKWWRLLVVTRCLCFCALRVMMAGGGQNWRHGCGWQPLDVPAGIRAAGSAEWWLVLLDDDVGPASPWGEVGGCSVHNGGTVVVL